MRRPLETLAALTLSLAPASAYALDWLGYVAGGLLLEAEANRPDDILRFDPNTGDLRPDAYLRPTLHQQTAALILSGGASVLWTPILATHFGLSSGAVRVEDGALIIDSRPARESLSAGRWLTAAWAELVDPKSGATLAVGRRPRELASGLLLDDLAWTAQVRAPVGPLTVEAEVLWTGRAPGGPEGPLFTGALVATAEGAQISLFAAATHDDQRAGEAIAQGIIDRFLLGMDPARAGLMDLALAHCYDRAATVDPWWIGLDGAFNVGSHRGYARGVLGYGHGLAEWRRKTTQACSALRGSLPAHVDRPYALSAAAVEAGGRFRASRWLYVGPRLLWATGDEGDTSDGMHTFFGFSPFRAHPALFFDVGLGAGLQADRAGGVGVDGHGLRVGGLGALFVLHERVELRAEAWSLWADAQPEARARHYGVELDLRLRWEPTDVVALTAGFDAMQLGAYYPEDDVWWRASTLLSFGWPP
jgi:hypothetical protein